MKQELPNLVDERRFRRREPDQVERDEFGRVGFIPFDLLLLRILNPASAQMARRAYSNRP